MIARQSLKPVVPAPLACDVPRVPGRRVALPPTWGFRAKSGTMEYSRALAGSFVTASGRAVALGLTLHDPVQRARTDSRFNPLIGGMSDAAADWLARARSFEVELTRGFIGALA